MLCLAFPKLLYTEAVLSVPPSMLKSVSCNLVADRNCVCPTTAACCSSAAVALCPDWPLLLIS